MAPAYGLSAYDRWSEYDRIDIPVLCLRGAESDLLLADTENRCATAGRVRWW
ncbi:hypothetical protein [Hydrogenophaga sp. MI9]|uniref:hypothetical protein n=1 Tax=Hydrogenophaga sp. MI9 TaxID=3453719 RepID=UPI003EEB2772